MVSRSSSSTEYAKETIEPYGDYMAHFGKMKNGADKTKKQAEKELERMEKEFEDSADTVSVHAQK